MKRQALKLTKMGPDWKDAILVTLGVILIAMLVQGWVQEYNDSKIQKMHHAELSEGRNEPHRPTRPAQNVDNKAQVETLQKLVGEQKGNAVEGLPVQRKQADLSSQMINVAQHHRKLQASLLPQGMLLDESTRRTYEKIHRINPHFKGWVDLPYWNISYPLFVDPEDPLAYLNKTYLGEPSRMGEVHYQGTPGKSQQVIIFGHTLTGRKGFAGLDILPESDWEQLPEEAKDVWLDLYETGTRYRFQMVFAEYRKNEDTAWAITDFGAGPYWKTFVSEQLKLDQMPSMLLTLSTCRMASRSIKSVVYAVPYLEGGGL